MYLVLVAGGHASGKHTVTKEIQELLTREAEDKVSIDLKTINLQDFAAPSEVQKPQNIDFDELKQELERFKSGESAGTHCVVFVFGNYALYNDEICDLASMKIFLDTDADVRLSRWILRDVVGAKKAKPDVILQTYLDKCKNEYSDYIEGTKLKADVLLPQGSDPLTAEVVVSGIISELTMGESTTRGSTRRPVFNLREEDNGMYYTAD